MKIMVYDIAAQESGALSILKEYYNNAILDTSNMYYFVVSIKDFKDTDNVKVLVFSEIKKSWFHRLYFDYFKAPKLVKQYKIDEILSLQNILVPRTKVKQTVYMHNILPFIDYKFKFKENKLLWIYQNIIGKLIKNSLKKAETIIVQAHWIKETLIRDCKLNPDKIDVKPPTINIEVKNSYIDTPEARKTFFYPATPLIYKNHQIIVDACKILKEKGITDYKVIFTLNGEENDLAKSLYNQARKEDLPIEFKGSLKREEVFELYTRTTLVFVSLVESSPLPLTEAKMHKTPIIAIDRPFSNEILKGYNALYINNNAEEISAVIKEAN